MNLTLPALPYAHEALEPFISATTLRLHHGVHHVTYLDKLASLVRGTELENESLESILDRSAAEGSPRTPTFNNAAQAWNHSFFWRSLQPAPKARAPRGGLADALARDFGGVVQFNDAFKKAAAAFFGSGWLWLLEDEHGLRIVATANADTPVVHGKRPLLVLDLWEHAYYLDYQARRASYVDSVVENLLNWEFAELNSARGEVLHA
jgi:Fe-Mn family superoxide dismutase